jgi:uncharacterized membrane-anchored protein
MIQLLVVILVIGVVLYLINNYVPMQPPWKTVFNVVIVLAVCIWLLQLVGLIGPFPLR